MSLAHLTVWHEEACKQVHEATIRVLAETGVEVRNYPAALRLFTKAGARVEGQRVYLPREVVEEALATAPRSWTVKSRGRPEVIELRDGPSYYGPGSDCLYVRDPVTADRRRARTADIEGISALCERLPNLDFVMSMGLPCDVPTQIDDLAQFVAMLRGTRKPLIICPREGSVVARMLQMAEVCGEGESFVVYAMSTPPLMHDYDALSKVIVCAELNIPLIYCPAPTAGATSPRSVAASVVVGNAEVLSGLVMHQTARRGAPFVMGVGAGAIDMRTAFDPHVVPETWLAQQVGADLARFYGLPSFNYAGMTDSKILDEQWTAEESLTVMLGALTRSTLLHDVGYLEVGLQSSYESLVLGNELVGFARTFAEGVACDAESLAVDEIAAVGPGGNHLGRDYTRRHHRSFWQSDLLDKTVFDRWVANGSLSLGERVRRRVRELMESERDSCLPDEMNCELERLLAESLTSRAAGLATAGIDPGLFVASLA